MEQNNAKVVVSAKTFISILKGEVKRFIKDDVDFSTITRQPYQGVVVENIIVNERVTIRKGDTFPYPITLGNCEFTQNVIIEGGEFQNAFIINGGVFKKNFIIYGGEFRDAVYIPSGQFKQEFNIEGGVFNRQVLIRGGELNNFEIKDGDFKLGFDIWGGEFKSLFVISGGTFNGFHIKDGDFKEKFKVWGGEFQSLFAISGGTFNDFIIKEGKFNDFYIKNGKFNDFIIYGGEFRGITNIGRGIFQGEFTIGGGQFRQVFQIESGLFLSDFRVTGGNFHGGLMITGGLFITKIIIPNIQALRLHIEDLSDKLEYYLFINILDCVLDSIQTIVLNKVMINYLIIREILRVGAVLKLEHLSLIQIIIDDFQNLGTVIINDVKARGKTLCVHKTTFDSLKTDIGDSCWTKIVEMFPQMKNVDTIQKFLEEKNELYNNKETNDKWHTLIKQKNMVSLHNTLSRFEKNYGKEVKEVELTDAKTLVFKNSDLGKTTFTKVDFESFGEGIKVSNTNFSNVLQYGQEKKHFFPLLNPKKKSSEIINSHQDLHQVYRDLGIAMGNQQDTNYRLRYLAASQRHQLHLGKWHENISSKVTILFNWLSNNFGQSWLCSLIGFIILSWILFLIAICSTAKKFAYFCEPDSANFLELSLQFINPTRRLFSDVDIFEPLERTPFCTSFVELISYVFMIAWLYQLIQAFRKYGRK